MRSARLLVFPAAVAFGVFAEWAALRRAPLEAGASGAELRLATADVVVGLVLAGCGAVAWSKRPESWTGRLLALTGFAWFLGTFAVSGEPRYADFGALFVTLHRGPLVHAVLSYPSGRVERGSDRAAIAFAYVVSAFPDVAQATAATLALAGVVTFVATRRMLGATGPTRAARRTAAWAGAALGGVLLAAALTHSGGASPAVEHGVEWAYDVVVAAVTLALTLDLLRGRWSRSTVTGLVVDLGEVSDAGELRDRLADALGDESLVVGYWFPEREAYVDDRGRVVELPPRASDRRLTVVGDEAEPIAALLHDAALAADPDLVDEVAAVARIAVANARLHAEVRRRVADLEASRRRLLDAGVAERGRLERQLHEGAEQRLVTIADLLRSARENAAGQMRPLVADLGANVDETLTELRAFAQGVHPRALSEGGLGVALQELASRSAVPVRVSVAAGRFPAAVEAAAYFVCSEALTNVAKHAAASHATVDVRRWSDVVVVSISDDGRGGADVDGGTGLRGLADRVQALGGHLTVASAPRDGTTVVAELPLV